MATPDGIDKANWDVVHELALAIAGTEGNREAAHRQEVDDWLDSNGGGPRSYDERPFLVRRTQWRGRQPCTHTASTFTEGRQILLRGEVGQPLVSYMHWTLAGL